MKAEEREKRARTTIDLEGDFDCYIIGLEEMKAYKNQLCKEQRDLCARAYIIQKGHDPEDNADAIRNAPKPGE